MSDRVTAPAMRASLVCLQEISGNQYAKILSQAGLAKYINNLPEADWQQTVPGEELNRLYKVVFDMLGEGGMRLYLRNNGITMAKLMLEMPPYKALALEGNAIPSEKKVAWFVQTIAKIISENWSTITIAEDQKAWYISLDFCSICEHISGAQAPICTLGSALYTYLSRELIGQRVEINEVQCNAVDQKKCKFSFQKLGFA